MFPELTRDDVFRLETRRLWLRWPFHADAERLLSLAGDRDVAEMTAAIPHPYPPEAIAPFIVRARAGNAAGRHLQLVLTRVSEPSKAIGMAGIGPNAEGLPQLGYWIGRPHWGHGFATEAVRVLIDAFFALTEHPRLEACTRVVNPASRRVLEKCGFAYHGAGLGEFPARGGLLPIDHFHLDRGAWESLKSWGLTGYVPHRPARELASA
jgi:RimJ/RimL family protein N-acetyltransferase